jgi:hypothetical protein
MDDKLRHRVHATAARPTALSKHGSIRCHEKQYADDERFATNEHSVILCGGPSPENTRDTRNDILVF